MSVWVEIDDPNWKHAAMLTGTCTNCNQMHWKKDVEAMIKRPSELEKVKCDCDY